MSARINAIDHLINEAEAVLRNITSWNAGSPDAIKRTQAANRRKTLMQELEKLYEEFLEKPNSEKAHHLLHTHYFDRKKKYIVKQ